MRHFSMIDHQSYMCRALELAALGLGNVSPNPLVGCVIVENNQIIGEGYHERFGEAHAEVNAVNSVHDKSLLQKSTVYVTLEPCSHFGKTPPCADLLIDNQVRKVIIAIEDPNPKVAGRGIQKLKDAGIEVELGLCKTDAYQVNRRFFTAFSKKRPYIILKWAETADGYIARENYDSKWISNEYSRSLVHSWRAEEDAILVGKNTAYHDNPKLTVRGIIGKNPLRVVVDRKLELDPELDLFSDGLSTVCYNTTQSKTVGKTEYVKIGDKNFLSNLLKDLNSRDIQSVIVEGGSQLLSSFIELDLWDEARVFKTKTFFNQGIPAPHLHLPYSEETLIDDKLLTYHNH
ncbi:MAG: bifunctional diaminohydroxyphosphoribosylaminopyrimidine deaminase/5-amino-6-(5-phosphoribosylamino)uracil reductase RibD [Bacteroidota bacterium]